MNPLDDLPQRDNTHDTAQAAEDALSQAINAHTFFVVQRADRNDYGTDVQIEARRGKAMTNVRIHAQLKGTGGSVNPDGSISVAVARKNLNYLLNQPSSLYVCYHLPSRRLLVRSAEDVFREYEHRGGDWMQQDNITVRFSEAFDAQFQERMNARLVASNKEARDYRLQWVVTPPEQVPALLEHMSAPVIVPIEPLQARELLSSLYAAGLDIAISGAFAQFAAVLNNFPGAMDPAYMAEINLGLNAFPCNAERIRQSIKIIDEAMNRGDAHRGSLLYCQGNAFLALGEHAEGIERYRSALALLDNPQFSDIAAQCNKNLGSAYEALGELDSARACYERALDLDPDLGEAHLALGLFHCKSGNNSLLALEHLDQVAQREGSALQMSTVRGWRINALFNTGDVGGAFREINSLIGAASQETWIWPWCARQVAQFGKLSVEHAQKALRFWRGYLRKYPDHTMAERERLLCLCRLRSVNAPTDIDFNGLKEVIGRLVENGDPDPAFLWDRLGHWAQDEENWEEAERAYRKAYELEPERYGYCLGTALNFLSQHTEALVVLLGHSAERQFDAMSWFQVAAAHAAIGSISESIDAYQRALELDLDYDLAWFNLGGVYWNSGDITRATKVWREAVARFPTHELTERLKRDLPSIFLE